MKVGINYVSSISKGLTQKLVNTGVIDVLKFPGVRCNEEEKFLFLRDFPSKAQADIHGLLHFNPAWNMPNIAQSTSQVENLPLFTQTGAKEFSTHIAQFPGEAGDPFKNFEENLKTMRKLLPGIRLGGENVFSMVGASGEAQYTTLQTSKPAFINEMWRRLDFAVFDIAHAKIAAKDQKMTFWEYLQALEKEKVEIIHITGSGMECNYDICTSHDADPHTPCQLKEFEELIAVLPYFPNVRLVISELAYSLQEGKRIPVKEVDYEREAKALSLAVKTRNVQTLRKLFEET
ncbi:MAG: hypothetical protein IJ777_03285 [Clostridia bacterium]|nr:hypothetical protein [Clostridia bacterium]